MPEIPQLPKCRICNNVELRFEIQKVIDNGATIKDIATKYNLTHSIIRKHIDEYHRVNLMAVGTMEYVIKKKALDVGKILSDYAEKWSDGVASRPVETIKDSDAIKAMELYLKSEGNLINKHEVTVKRSIEDALNDFLGEDEDETEHIKEEKGKNVETEKSETAVP